MLINILKKHLYFVLLCLILFFAFLLRAQESISGNYLFLIDQGRDMMAVKRIVFDHNLTLIGPYTSLQGVFQGPLWYYLLSIPTFLLRGNPVGGVWLMLVISMLVVGVGSYWVSRNFGNAAGLITAVLLAFSPQAIAAATFTWNPHPMYLLVLLYIIFFYKAVSKYPKFYVIVLPIASIMFHFETALAVFILGATIFYVILFKRKQVLSKYFLLGLALSLVFFLPQIVFDLRHQFLMTKSIVMIFTGSNQGLMVTGEEKTYFEVVRSHVDIIWTSIKTAFPFEGLLQPIPYIIFALVVYTGIKVFFEKKKNNILKFLSFLSVVTGIILISLVFFYPFPIREWFLTGIQVFYILNASVCLSLYSKNNFIFARRTPSSQTRRMNAKEYILPRDVLFAHVNLRTIPRAFSPRKFIKIIYILIAALIFYQGIAKINLLYFHPKDFGGIAKVKGKTEAIDFIYNDAKTKDFGLLVFTPPVYTYAYDYLIWWYGKNKYGYVPPEKKLNTFYLLIEPDQGRPWSYKGWLETVIKNGKVEKTVTLPSGFIIQKRSL